MTVYYAPKMVFDGLLYISATPGVTASTLLTGIVGDVSIAYSPEGVEVSPRGSRMKMYMSGQAECGITFEHNWTPDDAAFQVLQNSFYLGSAIAIRCKDYAAGKGPDWDVVVTKFDKKEPKGKQQTVEVELKPTIGYRDPNAGIYI